MTFQRHFPNDGASPHRDSSVRVGGPMGYLQEIELNPRNFAPFAQWMELFGFIPNLFKAQTLRPDFIETEAALAGAILMKEGALSRAQKEYVFLVCSAANLSTYCVTAHCEMIKTLGLKGPE